MSVFERLFVTITVLHGRLKDREEGASAVEYALLVAGVALAVGAAMTVFQGQLSAKFTGLIP